MKKPAKEEKLSSYLHFNNRNGYTRCKCAIVQSELILTRSLSSGLNSFSYDRGILNDLIQDGSFVSEGMPNQPLHL